MKTLVKKNLKSKYSVEAYVGCQQCSTCQWSCSCSCGTSSAYNSEYSSNYAVMSRSLYNNSYNVIIK